MFNKIYKHLKKIKEKIFFKKKIINVLKSHLTDDFNKMSLLESINNTKDISQNWMLKCSDMKYKYKKKNKFK